MKVKDSTVARFVTRVTLRKAQRRSAHRCLQTPKWYVANDEEDVTSAKDQFISDEITIHRGTIFCKHSRVVKATLQWMSLSYSYWITNRSSAADILF